MLQLGATAEPGVTFQNSAQTSAIGLSGIMSGPSQSSAVSPPAAGSAG